MGMDSIQAVLGEQLKDLYSAEKQLVKALPRMARAAGTQSLRTALQAHTSVTERQVERLERIAKRLELSLRGKHCKGMEGLIEEGKELFDEEGEPELLDAAMIAAAQKVEHYEISAYGSARALAETLGLDDVAQLLQETLDEESATDEKLTQISQQEVIPLAMKNGADSELRDPGPRKSRNGRARAGRNGGGRSAGRLGGRSKSRSR